VDEVAAQHAERLSRILGAWKSIALKSIESFENPDAGSGEYSAYEKKTHYIETAIGQRYLEQNIDPEGDSVAKLERYYSDASKSALLITEPGDPVRYLTIKRAFGSEDGGVTMRPAPLAYLYFGLEPLSEAIGRAKHLGERTAAGRPCDLFVLQGRYTQVYWLDKETSAPLRYQMYTSEENRALDRPLADWEAGPGNGVLGLPTSYRTTRYHSDQGDGTNVWYRIDGKVESITLDETYTESTFWPEITPETAVNDLVGEQIIPASLPPAEATSTTAADPIRAVPRPDPASTLTRALLPLGVVLLIALVVARWWRR
jgi:hypothetical protein